MDEVTAVPSHSVYSTTFSVPWRYADRSPIGEAVAALHGSTDSVQREFWADLKTRLLVVPHDQLLATEAGSYDVERARHIEFRDYRITREWFRYEGRLKQHIATLTCA